MRKLFALLLAMSALALLVIWMPGRDSDRQLAVVTEIAGKGLARVQSPADRAQAPESTAEAANGERRARTFSPSIPLVTPDRNQPAPAPARREPAPAPAAEPKAAASSTGELRVASGVRQPTPATTSRLTTSAPTDEAARYELVRSLQRELKRVGCYWGEIDGSWGGGSKRAMSSFIERVNAALPSEQPDYILLSLVQGYGEQVCGKACPTGQSLNEGRCTPNVVLAQSGKRQPAREAATASRSATTEGWGASVQAAPDSSFAPTIAAAPLPLPGRMSVGGPRPADAASADPSGLTPPARRPSRTADAETPSRSVGTTRRVRTSQNRPVVVYRPARTAYYRPAQRSAPRRLTFFDIFR